MDSPWPHQDRFPLLCVAIQQGRVWTEREGHELTLVGHKADARIVTQRVVWHLFGPFATGRHSPPTSHFVRSCVVAVCAAYFVSMSKCFIVQVANTGQTVCTARHRRFTRVPEPLARSLASAGKIDAWRTLNKNLLARYHSPASHTPRVYK